MCLFGAMMSPVQHIFMRHFPGRFSEDDFLKFYHDPYTVFEKDLKDIYKLKK